MKSFIANQGRFIGGLIGVISAITSYMDYKMLGLTLALITVVLVLASEKLKS